MTEQTEVSPDQRETSRPDSKVALAALCVAVLAAISAMFSGLESRWGLWDYSTGFSILR